MHTALLHRLTDIQYVQQTCGDLEAQLPKVPWVPHRGPGWNVGEGTVTGPVQ